MNMSYCKFENTAAAMRELHEELIARLENPGTVELAQADEYGNIEGGADNMSVYEIEGLRDILSMCIEIVETAGGTDELIEAIAEIPQ